MGKSNATPRWVILLICVIISLLMVSSKSLAPESDSSPSETHVTEEMTDSLFYL